MNLTLKRSQGLTIKNVQEHNRTAILREIYEQGLCSRTEIRQQVGLDQATVTRAVQKLVEDEIVVESLMSKGQGKRGRRSIGLQLSPNPHRIVVVRLQRLSFTVALLDLTGILLEAIEQPVDSSQSPPQIFEQIVIAVDKLLATCSSTVLGLGLTLPGPFLEASERIILMTESPAWQQFDLVHNLRKHYCDIPLFSKHDAKAAALAVWNKQGIAAGSRVMLYLSAGQGIGAGLVINGQVFRGSQGTAGEVGHTSITQDGPLCSCGNRGCLEFYSSRLALLRNLQRNSRCDLPQPPDFADVVHAYQQGESAVVREVDQVAAYLAQGLVNCINFVNPDLIVLGDEYTQFGEPFLRTIAERVKQCVLPKVFENVRFQLAQQQDDLVINGSYHHVLQSTLLESSNPQFSG